MKRFVFGVFAMFAIMTLAIVMTPASAMASNLTVEITGTFGTTYCTTVIAGGVNCSLAGIGSAGVTGIGSTSSPNGLDLTYDLINAPAGTYYVEVSENNLSGSNLSWTELANGNQNPGASTFVSAYVDPLNGLFTGGSTLCSSGPISTTSVAYSCSSGTQSLGSPFSLTQVVGITVTGSGTAGSSGDVQLDQKQVPEPSSLVMLGSGLIGLVGLRRRKLAA
jgi:hypothetical protein